MSEWLEVNSNYGALTIVLDFQNDPDVEKMLQEEYSEMEYVYYPAENDPELLKAEVLIRRITEAMDQMRLRRMGGERRFVFLLYVDYTKLTAAWVDEMNAYAQAIRERLDPPQSNCLLFLYFIRYDSTEREKKAAERAADALGLFLNRHYTGCERVCFCLYRGAMENWKSQIRGMVKFAYIVSRTAQEDFNGINILYNTFNAVVYEEFDEKETERWDKKIDTLKNKLEGRMDKDLSGLINLCLGKAKPVLDECRSRLAALDLQKGLFARSIREYRGFIFKQYCGAESGDVIAARQMAVDEIVSEDHIGTLSDDFPSWEENLTYPDMADAAAKHEYIQSKVLERLESSGDIGNDPHLRQAAGQLISVLGKRLLEETKQALKGKEEAVQRLKRYQISRDEAGRYKSIREYLESSDGDMVYRFPNCLRSLSDKKWLMVCGSVRISWEQNDYSAVGMENDTLFVTRMDPWQVQTLKVGKYTEEGSPDIQNIMNTVFGVK